MRNCYWFCCIFVINHTHTKQTKKQYVVYIFLPKLWCLCGKFSKLAHINLEIFLDFQFPPVLSYNFLHIVVQTTNLFIKYALERNDTTKLSIHQPCLGYNFPYYLCLSFYFITSYYSDACIIRLRNGAA